MMSSEFNQSIKHSKNFPFMCSVRVSLNEWGSAQSIPTCDLNILNGCRVKISTQGFTLRQITSCS